jgi:hypothetical protein
MMDGITKQLQAATFRGETFYVTSESIPQRGRKYAIHDYPNSDKRFAQDLGLLPASFEVQAIITSKNTETADPGLPTFGSSEEVVRAGPNFLRLAENLQNALDAKGTGRLVLPHLGALDVVALPYKVDYKHKSIGVIGFTLKFTISNTAEVPALSPSSIEDVYQASDEAKLDMQEKYAEKYEIPTDKKSLLTSANDYRKSVVNTVGVYSSRINNLNSQLQEIVLSVEADLISLVKDPQLLTEKLIYGNIALANGLFATLSDLFGPSGSSAEGVLSLIDFGKDLLDNGTSVGLSAIPLWDNDTKNRVTRNNNRTLNVESVRINALLLGYETAANFDYKTSEDISTTTISLEQAYEKVMLNGDSSGIFTNDSDFKILLDSVKTAAFSVLEQKAQQVFSVASLDIASEGSVFALSYILYAEQFNSPEDAQEASEQLLELNPGQNPSEITQDLKVFEVQS